MASLFKKKGEKTPVTTLSMKDGVVYLGETALAGLEQIEKALTVLACVPFNCPFECSIDISEGMLVLKTEDGQTGALSIEQDNLMRRIAQEGPNWMDGLEIGGPMGVWAPWLYVSR